VDEIVAILEAAVDEVEAAQRTPRSREVEE
jgi:hypothetical protein